jgi:glycerol-3-phosphate acyltransferase PlsY
MNHAVLGGSLVVVGYLLGSIPFGLVLARVFLGVDVRQVGSGNIGATNAARAGGKKLGVAVLILDAAKAMVPVAVTQQLTAGWGKEAPYWVMAVAVAAFAGHLFPIWLKFKGGKGVATGVGIFLVLSPWAALAGLGAYALLYAITRISSVGSLAGSAACVIGVFAQQGPESPLAWAGAAIGAMIWWRHRENIRRLLSGEEKRKMKV